MTGKAQSIIGKTITGIIARPGPGGQDEVVMFQFSDGSLFEVVSPKTRRELRKVGRQQANRPHDAQEGDNALRQMTIFPVDGIASGAATLPRAAA